MEIYLPLLQPEEIIVMHNNNELNITQENGYLSLPNFISPSSTFTVFRLLSPLFSSSVRSLQNLEQTLEIIKVDICLHEENLKPICTTNIFYYNDFQIVIVAELIGVHDECPVTVSWVYERQLYYGMFSTIPVSNEPTKNYHRTFASGLLVNPEMPSGNWVVILRLITGKELCRKEFRLLGRNRGEYGRLSPHLMAF